MKVPLNWLRDYINLEMPVAELVERLTVAGLEVVSARLFGLPKPDGLRVKLEEPGPVWDREKIVIARVRSVDKHPNADKLKIVSLDYGKAEAKKVVTGAPNLAVGDEGQIVVLGLTGSVLFDGHAEPKQLMELKPTELRGIPSDSMVCSAFELGIHDDHEGIILFEEDAPVGSPLMDYLGDVTLEIDVLPNMARCLALLGIAREVAALTGQSVKLPATEYPTTPGPIEEWVHVVITEANLCARYAAIVLRDVVIKPSPSWMQYRLTYAGMRPISNIVDITNYVMLEYGQPLHAFDYDILVKRAGGQTPTITIRPAQSGEKLVTLDKVERALSPEQLVIADTAGPIALAGVMGGLETEVTERTRNILLESANFDPVSIRKTARHFDLPSEASRRFSRGIHPELVEPAGRRATQLMHQYANGQVIEGLVDVFPQRLPPQSITLRATTIRRLLGIELPGAEIERILTGLDFQVRATDAGIWHVTPPPSRVDLQAGEADLVEELARIHGYDRLPTTLLADELPPQRGNPALDQEERVRDLLADLGLQEFITYGLTTPETEQQLGIPLGEYLGLRNPLTADRSVLRQQLLPSLLEVVAENLKHTSTITCFEIGPVFHVQSGQKLPKELSRLAMVLTGRRHPAAWDDPLEGASNGVAALDFFDMKGILEELLEALSVLQRVYVLRRDVPFLHPGKAAELCCQDQAIGVLGELHPKVTHEFGLGERRVIVAELDLNTLLVAEPPRQTYRPIGRFQPALRDIAVIVDQDLPAERVLATIQAAGGALLREAQLFDVYQGSHIPERKKSLAYALTYQAPDHTLNEKEVHKVHEAIEARLKKELSAQIRGKE